MPPALLLTFTFIVGAGSVLTSPAYQFPSKLGALPAEMWALRSDADGISLDRAGWNPQGPRREFLGPIESRLDNSKHRECPPSWRYTRNQTTGLTDALSNSEYEVHYIGVNWPHHIFVNQDFKVVGAN